MRSEEQSDRGEIDPTPSEAELPVDSYNLAYLIFVLLGAGGMFPWNAFLSALDYWNQFYPSLHAAYSLSFIFNVPNFLSCVLVATFGNRIHVSIRIYTVFITFFVAMQIITTIVLTKMTRPDIAHPLVMIICAVLGIAGAIGNSAILSMAAQYPPHYTQAVMAGQAWSGMVLIVLRAITKSAFSLSPSGLRSSSIVFFEVATFVLFLCLVGYYVLSQLPITTYYTRGHVTPTKLRRIATISSLGDSTPIFSYAATPIKSPLRSSVSISSLNLNSAKSSQLVQVFQAFRQLWDLCLALMTVFVVTFVVFPGLMCSFPSTINVSHWYLIILLSIFMIGDLIGRTGPRYFAISERSTLILTYLRVLFVWFFLIHATTSWKIPSAVVMLAGFLLAVTNGYSCSLLMMYAPSRVVYDLKSVAGLVMVLFLTAGRFLGSIIAYILHHMIDN